MRTLFRSWIRGTANAWGSVRVGNFEANQSRTRGWRRARTSSRDDCFVTLRIISRPREKSRRIAAGPTRALGAGLRTSVAKRSEESASEFDDRTNKRLYALPDKFPILRCPMASRGIPFTVAFLLGALVIAPIVARAPDVVPPWGTGWGPTGSGVQVNTNLLVAWSERMDLTSVEAAFSHSHRVEMHT